MVLGPLQPHARMLQLGAGESQVGWSEICRRDVHGGLVERGCQIVVPLNRRDAIRRARTNSSVRIRIGALRAPGRADLRLGALAALRTLAQELLTARALSALLAAGAARAFDLSCPLLRALC